MIFEKISRFFLAVVTLPIWLPILIWLYLVFTLLNFEIDPEQTDEEVEDEM
jgi:ABC-type spermidine/putrescine transport system permease subunit I